MHEIVQRHEFVKDRVETEVLEQLLLDAETRMVPILDDETSTCWET